MKQPDTAAARDRAKRLVKLSKERDMYFTEKDGTRADSVSVRYPAYAGTALQAKRGGRLNAKAGGFNRKEVRKSDGNQTGAEPGNTEWA